MVPGGIEKFLRWCDLNDLATLHHRYPVARFIHHGQIV
jgi:hypothetical protein